MKVFIPILLAVFFTFGIFYLPTQTSKINLHISSYDYLNFQMNYQLLLLSVAILSMISSYLLNPNQFISTLSIGNLSAIGTKSTLFGIKEGDSWLKTGISLSVFISLATGTFMYFQTKELAIDYQLLHVNIFWILLFAMTNAFSEEMIYRVGINSPLANLLSPSKIFLISAIIFGLAHFQGMPNGMIGVILAGLLGYVLSKSIHETNGIFWAWFIHFLQDVIIIGSLFLIKSTILI